MFLYNFIGLLAVSVILGTPAYVFFVMCHELSIKERACYSIISLLQAILFFYAVYKIQGYDYFYTHLLRGFEKDILLFKYFKILYETNYAKFWVKFISHFLNLVHFFFFEKCIVFICLFIWVFVCVDVMPKIINEYISKGWKLIFFFFLFNNYDIDRLCFSSCYIYAWTFILDLVKIFN